MAEGENVAAGPEGVEEDEEEEGEDADLPDEPSSTRKYGGDDDEDGPSLLARRTSTKAVQSQGPAARSTKGGEAERSQPQGEKPPP